MRHLYRLLIAGLFLSTACMAQDVSQSSLEISPGVGIPVGDFASKANNIKAGLAMNGVAINIEYNHYFRPKLGFCAGLKRSVFPLDFDAYTHSNPNATSDPWRVLLIYGGLTTRKNVGHKTILTPKVAIGLATSKYPAATILTYNSSGPIVTTFSSNTGNAPAFIVGMTFKYLLSQRIHIGLYGDYFSASPKFIVTESFTSGQSTVSRSLPYTQNMQALMAGLSLCYNFHPND
jgi:hypothetical protein